jgi:hypothetical protein
MASCVAQGCAFFKTPAPVKLMPKTVLAAVHHRLLRLASMRCQHPCPHDASSPAPRTGWASELCSAAARVLGLKSHSNKCTISQWLSNLAVSLPTVSEHVCGHVAWQWRSVRADCQVPRRKPPVQLAAADSAAQVKV